MLHCVCTVQCASTLCSIVSPSAFVRRRLPDRCLLHYASTYIYYKYVYMTSRNAQWKHPHLAYPLIADLQWTFGRAQRPINFRCVQYERIYKSTQFALVVDENIFPSIREIPCKGKIVLVTCEREWKMVLILCALSDKPFLLNVRSIAFTPSNMYRIEFQMLRITSWCLVFHHTMNWVAHKSRDMTENQCWAVVGNRSHIHSNSHKS